MASIIARRMSNPLVSFWGGLIALAEARPEARAINRLDALSDEELAARGLTRMGELRRILGARYLL
ncbi:MAG: hypothetical protein R3D63_08700 [Paracoccaceae bacterium]